MTAVLHRSGVVGATLAVVLVVGMPSASADDLADMLDRSHGSTYSATRLTVSVWGDQTKVTKERVEHVDGAEMIRVDETWSMIGNGRSVRMGEAPEGIAFMAESEPIATDRYVLGDATACSHMRRPCTLFPIFEGDLTRAHVIVDDRTGAPLITYIYDDAGRTFRTISLSDFSPHRTYEWSSDPSVVPYEVVMQADPDVVPSAIAEYALVDVFPGPSDRSEQGFYSDGLFTFSLFALPSGTVVGGFEDQQSLVTSSGVYDATLTAANVRVRWISGGTAYVLVGDLPPDHLEAVLAELPPPTKDGMLARFWRALFG
jgi:hypothetical protein